MSAAQQGVVLGKITRLLALLLALPIVAAAAPNATDGSCTPVRDAAGNLVCSLTGVLASASSAPSCGGAFDLKGFEKRIRDSAAIGFVTKLALKSEVDAMLLEARAIRGAGVGPDRAAALQVRFATLHSGVVTKLASDPALASEVSCNRDSLWKALLAN